MGKHAISAAAFALAAGISIAPGLAQEVKQDAKSAASQAKISSVTQDLLNRPHERNNFLLTNGNYAQTRYYPEARSTSPMSRTFTPPGFSRPTSRIARNLADRRRRRDVRHHSFDHVYALDAKTGAEIWHYKHKLGPITTYCCGPNNRGVAVYGDKVYVATLDAKLVALDAKTGAVDGRSEIADPDRATAKRWRRRYQGQGPDRHQRRRIWHPRLRQGLSTPRPASCSGHSTPCRRIRLASGRKRTRPAETCIATSRRKRRAYAKSGDPTRRSAAASGKTRRRSCDQPDLFRRR